MTPSAWSAAETAARESYGRLLAWLASQWRDVAAAEDALADAFEAALRTWPRDGVPDAPDAWLLSAARRRMLHAHRHRRVVRAHSEATLQDDDALDPDHEPDPDTIPDRRLALMFVCTHPAIDASVRSALMLQVVLGLDASVLASAYLVTPATLAQRLVRAKRRIVEAGIAFEPPGRDQWAERVHSVLEAIYAAYSIGSDANDGEGAPDLAVEALYLARVVASLLPGEAEALGLLALLQFSTSRRTARFTSDGAFVPLHEQDTTRWDREAIIEADRLLLHAASQRRPGPLQLEAAIQSAHCQRLFTGQVPWRAIATLYTHLVQAAPTVGARVGHAVALCESGQAHAALDALDAIDAAQCAQYQPYWTARAHVTAALGHSTVAAEAYGRAIGLTTNAPTRVYLQARLRALGPAA